MNDPYGAYARFYDLDLKDMEDDLPFLEGMAARCGSPILELACGTGRALLPLARRGFHVTGVDVSPAMLAIAQSRLQVAGLEGRVRLVQQDMRELDLGGRFNLAFALVNSFSHMLTLDDQLAALAAIRRHLEPGGILILDLFNPDMGRLLDFRGHVVLDKQMADPRTGHTITKYRSEQVDLGQQVIDVTYVMDEVDGEGRLRRTIFPFALRYFFRFELELLLRHAGLELEAMYGSYDLEEFGGESSKMIAVARKPC
jgi:SAM-dependent methyltransferase